MFVGKESIGKLLIAKEFAKAILCTAEEKACNNCKSCIEFDTNNNPDFSILEPDGNSIKIDQIRELTKKVYEKPVVSNKKVYIIILSILILTLGGYIIYDKVLIDEKVKEEIQGY